MPKLQYKFVLVRCAHVAEQLEGGFGGGGQGKGREERSGWFAFVQTSTTG